MPSNPQSNSCSTLSTSSLDDSGSSRSSSKERHSYPAKATPNAVQAHRRNVHSAPSTIPTTRTGSQNSNLTTKSSASSEQDLSAATLPKASANNNEKATFRDALEKAEASKSKLKKRLPESPPAASGTTDAGNSPKGKRSCTTGLDWTYSNVYASGSQYGRKTVGSGSGAPGACSLM
ncbi:hypothetical protein ACLMJK_005281 [Lecanora helva]